MEPSHRFLIKIFFFQKQRISDAARVSYGVYTETPMKHLIIKGVEIGGRYISHFFSTKNI